MDNDRMKSFAEIKNEVYDARKEAVKEAHRAYKFAVSRGTFLATLNQFGQCDPRPEAECPAWRGTLKEIKNLITLVEAKYPDVTKIYIAGGYDGSNSLYDYNLGEYEPWVSSWEVTVWKRPLTSE